MENQKTNMPPWWQRAVVYQIYPKSFMDSNGDGIGDLKGIEQKLPYLAELGVDVLWLSPFYPGPGRDNGYDISNYETVDPVYGTDEDFNRLLDAAHALGLRVIIDLVVNHTSNEHPWFIESRDCPSGEKGDWYIWHDPVDGGPPNQWGSQFGGSAWTYDEGRGQYYLHLFSSYQPDLNWKNEAVRQEVYAMMRRWLGRGVDGFRMDVISLIAKPDSFLDGQSHDNGRGFEDWHSAVANQPMVHTYLKEMHREALSQDGLMTVGEASGVTIEEAKKYAALDGSELNMVFQFEHVGLDGSEDFKWTTQTIPVKELKRVMNRWQTQLEGMAWNSLFWCSHDQPRIVSRLGAQDEYRERSAKMLATCLHFMKGTPYIFQGEELGMTNFPFQAPEQLRDIESQNAYRLLVGNGRYSKNEMLDILSMKSRDNARTPMQWSAEPMAGFTTGTPWIDINPNHRVINTVEQMGRADSVYSYYKKLLALRHSNDCMAFGQFIPIEDDSTSVYAYHRILGDEQLTILCNFTEVEQYYPLPDGSKDVLIGNVTKSSYCRTNILAPWETIVLQV